MEKVVEKRRFQWLKGPKQGKVETYKLVVQEGDSNFIVFESGKRVSADLVGDYIVEITTEGEPFINMSALKPDVVKPATKADKVLGGNFSNKQVNKQINKTKSDNFSLSDLIKKQLDKNKEVISIDLDIPILKKDLYILLEDTHDDLLGDLSKIIIDTYINKENIEILIKEKIENYYGIKNN